MLATLEQKDVDLALLDVRMGALSGLDVVDTAADLGVEVVLVTAHPEHAACAYDRGAPRVRRFRTRARCSHWEGPGLGRWYGRSVMAGHLDTAERVRAQLAGELFTPAAFRAALAEVPTSERDAWVDRVLGIDDIPHDEPSLPRGCAPYLPCPVATVLDAVREAAITSADVFVDVGSGLGRTTALAHLLTGAGCIGLEIQPRLARAGRALAARLDLSRSSVIEGDAVDLLRFITIGTAFFLYCPFTGERLRRVLSVLEGIARMRPIRICCVDMPPLACPWLVPIAPLGESLCIYRSIAPASVGRARP